jgi:hypothetical protein
VSARAELTQRQQIEGLLVDCGALGLHSFSLYQAGLPRAAVVVDRLRKAGWQIDSVPEPSPTGAQGVRYILRSRPGDRAADNSAEPQQQQSELALELPTGNPTGSAIFGADWGSA